MVSCIITTYNRETNILRRAIDSILAQTYKDIELIVVNDYPENRELALSVQYLVKSYKDENTTSIRYIEHEKNSGACAARNTGIKASLGEYIAFLDDDDEWLPEKLETLLPLMKDSVGIAYSAYSIFSAEGERAFCPPKYNGEWHRHLLGSNYIGSTSFPVLRKKYLIDAGLFDVKMPSMQDWDMWLRMTKISKAAFSDKVLTKYYVESESITTNTAKKKCGHDLIFDKYRAEYSDYRKQYSEHLTLAGYDFWKYGDKRNGYFYILRGIGAYPFTLNHAKILKRMLKRRIKG